MSVTVSSSLAPLLPRAAQMSQPPPPSPSSPPPPSCSTAIPKSPDGARDATRSSSPMVSSPQKKKPRVDDFETGEPTVCSPVVAAEPLHAAPAAETPSLFSASPVAPHGHALTWSVSTQRGYKNTFGGNRFSIHHEMEDVHWPVSEAESRVVGEESTRNGTRLFAIADGHGGVEAPRFFVAGAIRQIASLLESREWDFADADHQQSLRSQIHTIFQILDASYSSKKVEEYRKWIDAGGGVEGATAATVGEKKPVDDGCTLVVNVIAKGWLININVGDSRTVVGLKHEDVGWEPVFSSSDHNMTHPAKIHHIQRTGGQFIYPYGNLKCVTLPTTDEPPEQPYSQLIGMRIYRPPTTQIRAVGVSHRRTLNLSATMGDLLFKVEPAVLSCLPDVEFVKIIPNEEYVIVAATDGVWDHMRVQNPQMQNKVVVQRVGLLIDCDSSPASNSPTQSSATLGSECHSALSMDSSPIASPASPEESNIAPSDVCTPPASMPLASAPQINCVDSPSPASTTAPSSDRARAVAHSRRLALASRTLVERERNRSRAWDDLGTQGADHVGPRSVVPRALPDEGADHSNMHDSSSSPSPSTTLGSLPELFWTGQFRYDDATAFIIHLKPDQSR